MATTQWRCAAWVLLRQKYLGNKIIVHFITPEHGMVSAMTNMRSKYKNDLQLGQLSQVEVIERTTSGLATLLTAESEYIPLSARGQAGLLHMSHFLYTMLAPARGDNIGAIYNLYTKLVYDLTTHAQQDDVRTLCLNFQVQVLYELGWWPVLSVDSHDQILQPEQIYQYEVSTASLHHNSHHSHDSHYSHQNELRATGLDWNAVATFQCDTKARHILAHKMIQLQMQQIKPQLQVKPR